MFALRTASFFLAAATLALASPTPIPQGLPSTRSTKDCSTGNIQCCNTIINNSPSSDQQASWIPTALQGLGVPIALGCSPLSYVGGGVGGTCSAQATCCSGYSSGYGIGCIPISL